MSLLLFLSSDQAGRSQWVATPPGGRAVPGGSLHLDLRAPQGRYRVAVRLRLATPLDTLSLVVGDRTLVCHRVPVTHQAVRDVPMGTISIDKETVRAVLTTSKGGGALLGVVLERALPFWLSLDILERAFGALAVLFLMLASGQAFLRHPWAAALLALAPALLRLSCYGLVTYVPGDMSNAFWPWYDLSLRQFRAGLLPLWNPHTFLGLPHLANVQAQVLYPPVAACLALGVPFGTRESLLWALHLIVAAIGAGKLSRSLGSSAFGAGVAGLLFALSPTLLNYHQAPLLYSSALLPWCVLATLGRRRPAALASALALGFLAGHSQWFLYILLAVVIAVAIPPVPRRQALPPRSALCGALLGVLAVSAVALPFVEHAQKSARNLGFHPRTAAGGGIDLSFAPRALFGVLADSFIPGLATARYSPAPFVGSGGLLLLAAALVDGARPRRRRATAWLLLLALVGIALAAKARGPLSPFALLGSLPPFSSVRIPSRALILTVLSVSVLCGRGVDRLRLGLRMPRSLRPVVMAASALGAAGLVAAWAHGRGVAGGFVSGLTIEAALLGATSLVALGWLRLPASALMVVVALMASGRADDCWSMRPGSFPSVYLENPVLRRSPPPGLRELQVRGRWNQSLLTSRLSPWGYDPIVPRRTTLLWDCLRRPPFAFDAQGRFATAKPYLTEAELTDPRSLPLLQAFGVARVLGEARADATKGGDRPGARFGGEIPIAGAARARIVTGPRFAATSEAAWEGLRHAVEGPDPEPLPAIIESVERGGGGGDERLGGPSRPRPIVISDRGPHEVQVSLPRRHDAGWLILSDAFFPGWVADVDGAPRPIHPACVALRAVRISPQDRTVTFRYRPFSYRLGLFLTGIGLALCLASWGSRDLPSDRDPSLREALSRAGGRRDVVVVRVSAGGAAEVRP